MKIEGQCLKGLIGLTTSFHNSSFTFHPSTSTYKSMILPTLPYKVTGCNY